MTGGLVCRKGGTVLCCRTGDRNPGRGRPYAGAGRCRRGERRGVAGWVGPAAMMAVPVDSPLRRVGPMLLSCPLVVVHYACCLREITWWIRESRVGNGRSRKRTYMCNLSAVSRLRPEELLPPRCQCGIFFCVFHCLCCSMVLLLVGCLVIYFNYLCVKCFFCAGDVDLWI